MSLIDLEAGFHPILPVYKISTQWDASWNEKERDSQEDATHSRFADISDFITYLSSHTGYEVASGFCGSVHADPDILILDGFGAGDEDFQKSQN